MNFTTTSLDVTPNATFNTLQFERETLNVIVSSVIVALILNNFSTIISKFEQRAPHGSFSFNSCRRFVVFLNSDDPLRLLKWWFGEYIYREKHWKRNKQKTEVKFLVAPLSARLFLFLASIVSIAISIPTENVLSGCENGDFRPILNVSQARISSAELPPCVGIPMVSRLGSVTSTLKYCILPTLSRSRRFNGSPTISADTTGGTISWDLSGNSTLAFFSTSIEWTSTSGNDSESIPSASITDEQVIEVLLEGLVRLGVDCETSQLDGGDLGNFTSFDNNCTLVVENVAETLNSFLLSSIVMEKVPERQMRTQPGVDGTTLDCPIDVVVSRPLVNLVPLSIFLVAIVVINATVSVLVSRHGNIVDSSYHLMKEVFDHDSTSNPLEDPCDVGEQVDALPLRRVLRGENGHVGFLECRGDQAVDDFGEETVVCDSKFVMERSSTIEPLLDPSARF